MDDDVFREERNFDFSWFCFFFLDKNSCNGGNFR